MPDPQNPSSDHRSVLVLVGPTCSGKSVVAIDLANALNGEILSADSRQLYKWMDIGTAKPPQDVLRSVPHHFVDELDPTRDFNAGEFSMRGREIVEEIFSRGKVPIVVGGSGLYVQALVDGFFEGPSASPSLREQLYGRLEHEGAESMLEELRRIDPVAASTMLPSNTRRIVRALEVFRLTGSRISDLQKTIIEPSFQPVFAGLQWERRILYERINRRVDEMLRQGLLHEVRSLRARGYTASLNALQTTGYIEAFQYLDGSISFDRMVELIKRNTRRYAKRQLTWFRYDERIRWFGMEGEADVPEVALAIVDYFRQRQVNR